MTTPDLGPLPDTSWTLAVEGDGYSPDRLLYEAAYDADQMRAYALQEVAKERERCAKLCDDLEARVWRTYKNGGAANQHTEGRSDGAGECAALIREEKA
jgi:hypothetical protein